MPRRLSKSTPAENIEYQKPKTAADGSGVSGGGPPSGAKTISLMALLVRQRQGDLLEPLISEKEGWPESET